MVQSIVVYTFLAGTMLWASISYSNSSLTSIQLKDVRILYIILIYSFICGIRYDVGVDYMSYYESYDSYVRFGASQAEISQEPGWLWYTNLLASQGLHYSIYFATIAFAQIFLIVFAFKKSPELLPYVIFVFFVSEWFILSQNVLRQIIVTLLSLYIVIRYPKISLLKSIIISLLAACIHSTGILICIFIPIVKYDWSKVNFKPFMLITIYIFIAAIGLKVKILDTIVSNPIFNLILAGSDYQYYLTANKIDQGADTIIGLGYLLNIIVRCIIISQYKNISKNYPKYRFKSWFYCYYISLCITALFPTSILFTRLFWFLSILNIPVFAVFFKYCFNTISINVNRKFRMQIGTIVLSCMLMLSVTSLYLKPEGGNMLYKFFWQIH